MFQSDISALLQLVKESPISADGPALIELGNELKRLGRSASARANRTNKKKTLQRVREEWVAKAGVDPLKLHAMATLLHESATSGHRKWNTSVEVALMVLRPDLSHPRGIFRPGAEVPPKFRRQPSARDMTTVDQNRNAVIRKLRSAMSYREGPLYLSFEEITSQAKSLVLRELIANHRTASVLGHAIANLGR